jgi:S-adenosylmethionine hydrolase
MRPIVALLSDFGTADAYVGAMKGAVLSACPEATLVDLVHDIPAQDVAEGAYALAAAFQAFPPRTVFLAVVDPGVGSERRGLALETRGYRFVGPDNGIFTHVLEPGTSVRSITNAGLFRYRVSATFHGRDIFGPVAGHLAGGLSLEEVGPEVSDPVRLKEEPLVRGPSGWEGKVIHVDRFGNLITNVSEEDLEAILAEVGGDPNRLVGAVSGVRLPLARTYADVAPGEACLLMGSAGRLEVAVNGGSASSRLGAGRGTSVLLLPLGDPFEAHGS